MASQRRGNPPDLKSTLGSLLRTTLDQFGVVKDVVESQVSSRGGLLDQALVNRRRKEAFAKLGESIYRLSKHGELGELALDPEIGMAISDIEALESDLQEDWDNQGGSSHHRRGEEAVSSANYRPPPASADKEMRIWRPVIPEDELDSEEIVSEEQDVATSEVQASAKDTGPLRIPRKIAQRKQGGGIRFVEERPGSDDLDSDDDLESYMHDDDV